jgi:tRNA-dihydrouridine synthase 2
MSAVARLTSRFATLFSTRMMPVALRPAADEPPAKRLKMESAAAPVAAPTSPTTSAASPLSKKQSKTQQKAAAKAAERAAGGSFRPRPDVPTAGELAEIAALQAAAPEFTRSYAHEVEYRGKMVLAPMVRSGSLPTRLLSLYYGAGLVWSPEIVDKAIIGATRSVDRE